MELDTPKTPLAKQMLREEAWREHPLFANAKDYSMPLFGSCFRPCFLVVWKDIWPTPRRVLGRFCVTRSAHARKQTMAGAVQDPMNGLLNPDDYEKGLELGSQRYLSSGFGFGTEKHLCPFMTDCWWTRKSKSLDQTQPNFHPFIVRYVFISYQYSICQHKS